MSSPEAEQYAAGVIAAMKGNGELQNYDDALRAAENHISGQHTSTRQAVLKALRHHFEDRPEQPEKAA